MCKYRQLPFDGSTSRTERKCVRRPAGTLMHNTRRTRSAHNNNSRGSKSGLLRSSAYQNRRTYSNVVLILPPSHQVLHAIQYFPLYITAPMAAVAHPSLSNLAASSKLFHFLKGLDESIRKNDVDGLHNFLLSSLVSHTIICLSLRSLTIV